MLEPVDKLARSLWDLFLPEIKAGEPVRFCFSHDLLREHFATSGLSFDDPTSYVCGVAQTCFRISSNRAWLPAETLNSGKNDVSRAIVLVCQQVLAVEEMVREGTQYSENAYFPRLRRLMNPTLPPWSSNPFSFEDFEAIWKTFAREVWRIDGSTDQTVTFEFNTYSGVNKARQFPLSQALFSRADLLELVRRCGVGRLCDRPASDVWTEIRRERYAFSRRAQALINSGFLRERLIEQVQKSAARLRANSMSPSPSPSRIVEETDLYISLEVVDWVHEEYRAFLIGQKTGGRIDDTKEISKKFEGVFRRDGFAYCVSNRLGDCWTFREGVAEVSPGEAILLIALQSGIQRGKASLSALGREVTVDEARVRSIGAINPVFVAPILLPSNLGRDVRIKAGRIVLDTAEPGQKPTSGRWSGGLCIEARQQKYLWPFLPSSVRFGSQEYSVQSLVRVGDTRMEWRHFTNGVAKLESDGQFDMHFPEGQTIRLAIAVRRDLPVERMGFLFDSKGLLSPTLERLGHSDLAVIGFCTPDQRVERPADLATVAALLMDLKGRLGRPLTDKERHVVWARVSTSSVPQTVKSLIAELLKRRPLARDEVLTQLVSGRRSCSSPPLCSKTL